MFPQVDTKDPAAVEAEVRACYFRSFPDGDPNLISTLFGWAKTCFSGGYDHYQAIDARYHDFEHTLQGTLCLARLLEGYCLAGAEPRIPRPVFELGIAAILFHDTGYLKTRDDLDGTGAKYTLTHVARSAEFAARFFEPRGFSPEAIEAIQQMIGCTGVNADLARIPFHDEEVKIVGFALGASDLLGQMAAADYVDKLGILYLEFAEAAQFNGNAPAPFSSEEDLRRKTPFFWEKYVLPKINRDFLGLHRYLNRPLPDGPNFNLDQIERNIARLKVELAAVSA